MNIRKLVKGGTAATSEMVISIFCDGFNSCKEWECCNPISGNFHFNKAKVEKKDHPVACGFPPFTMDFTVIKGGNVASLDVDISILI